LPQFSIAAAPNNSTRSGAESHRCPRRDHLIGHLPAGRSVSSSSINSPCFEHFRSDQRRTGMYVGRRDDDGANGCGGPARAEGIQPVPGVSVVLRSTANLTGRSVRRWGCPIMMLALRRADHQHVRAAAERRVGPARRSYAACDRTSAPRR
jgi:hypothetical protein